MKTINDYKYSQRAVAPIIATLLMVAISVVGGILIFVFAQGFFTDTNIGTPNIESLEIFGYDASDVAALRTHVFDPITGTNTVTVSAAASSNLKDNDGITLFVRNKGAGPVTIDRIKVYGTDYLWDLAATGGTASATVPVAQKFALSSDGTVDLTDGPVIEPGQEVTIYIRYEQDTNGLVKIGRPIPVVVVTGNGATFTKQLQNGVKFG